MTPSRPSVVTAPSRKNWPTEGTACLGAPQTERQASNMQASGNFCVRGRAQGHLNDFGHNTETKGHDAAAKTPGDDNVAIHARVTVSQYVRVAGINDGRPAEHPHLPAMRMPRELQRDARG